MANDPPLLPPPDETPLLAAPKAPLLLPAPESRLRKHAKPITALAVAGFLVVAFAVGWFLHHRRAEAAKETNEAERDALPLTTVVPVKRSPSLSEMLLPGSLSPITEASLYARASGYLQRRYVDIGDAVVKGQVLAVIESPELDQQVAQGVAAEAQARQQVSQAAASVADAQARVDLALVTVQRYETLLEQDSIARQDVDVQRQTYQSALATLASAKANVGAADENVRAAEANTRRLVALQRFEQLRAPFDGVITERNVDEGALISTAGASLVGGSSSSLSSIGSSSGSTSTGGSATSSGTSDSSSSTGSGSSSSSSGNAGMPLFRIAQDDRLRVYVSVPQENASAIQLGANAQVFVQQFADRFQGRVARTARAIDPTSRTLLTEVQIPNGQHTLLPGMYAQVRFASERSDPPLLVPGETVIARADGTKVAVLRELSDDDKRKLADPADARCARKVHLQPVSIGRDYGTEVEVTQGLKSGEFVLLNPGDASTEGALMLPQLHADDSGESGDQKKPGRDGDNNRKKESGAGGDKKGDDKKGDAKNGGDKGGNDGKQQRQQARSTCVEEQYRRAQAERNPEPPAPAGGGGEAASAAASQPGGPSDRQPEGGSVAEHASAIGHHRRRPDLRRRDGSKRSVCRRRRLPVISPARQSRRGSGR